MSRSLQEKAGLARQATLGCLGLLLLVLVCETPLLAPAGVGMTSLLLIIVLKTLPLAAFLLPIQRGRAMSAVWLGFVLMLYFCWAVLGLFVHGSEAMLALVRTLLITACFSAAMLFARWQRALQMT